MAGPSTHPSEGVIDLHNEMVLKISKEIFPRNLPDWDDLLGLFQDNPLTPADIEGLKNIQGLFDLLMKYGKIDHGKYDFFVRKADNVNKRVVKIVKKYMDDIQKLDVPSSSPRIRSTRRRRCKFVGRHISHQWCIDDSTNKTKWYEGKVLNCVKGKDGQDGALYKVKYKGEKDQYLVNHLQQDLDNGVLEFINI